MEKNTVLLDVAVYDSLRDFENNIRSGKIYTSIGYGDQEYRFYTTDEALAIAKKKHDNAADLERAARKDAIDLRESLRNAFKRYENKTAAIQAECNERIENIKKMSTREFRRWKKLKE